MHAFDRQTDRQTDRRTDGQKSHRKTALHSMQRGKKGWWSVGRPAGLRWITDRRTVLSHVIMFNVQHGDNALHFTKFCAVHYIKPGIKLSYTTGLNFTLNIAMTIIPYVCLLHCSWRFSVERCSCNYGTIFGDFYQIREYTEINDHSNQVNGRVVREWTFATMKVTYF